MPLEIRISKNVPNTQDSALNSQYFDNPLASTDPKDVSDRTLIAFENYLAQVNSMYFNFGSEQERPTLNEVSSRISNNQNGLPIESDKPQSLVESRLTDEESNVISNDFHYSTLDVLWNPLRVPHVFENWSPREIAIFETWICKFGKNFNQFSKFIKTKNTREVVEFYFFWKNTSHYKIWQQKMNSCISEDHNDWIFK